MATVALIGVPGSGKSAVGAALADLRGAEFLDVAEQLGGENAVVQLGMAEATRRALDLATTQQDAVIAMPSWATRGPDESRVVYLLSTAGESFARSGMNRAGPVGLINPRSLWAQMLRERDPEYRAGAELVVEVAGKTVADIAAEIDTLLG